MAYKSKTVAKRIKANTSVSLRIQSAQNTRKQRIYMWKYDVYRQHFHVHQSPLTKWCWERIWIYPALRWAHQCHMWNGWKVRKAKICKNQYFEHIYLSLAGAQDLTPENDIPIGRNILQLTNIQQSANFTCIAASSLGQIEATAMVKVQCKFFESS